MLFSEAQDRVANDCRVNTSVSSVSTRLKQEINRACEEIFTQFRWSWRWKNYRFVTDVDVTAGTVTATNGSFAITGAGTAFLSGHVEWHICFPADSVQNWYKVRQFTSTTSIGLDVPYQGTTGSGKQYILRHFDYGMPPEAFDLGSVIVTSERRSLAILEPTSIDLMGPVPFYSGSPTACSLYSSNTMPRGGPWRYSVGTATTSIGENYITGVGTAWLTQTTPSPNLSGNYGPVLPGDEIRYTASATEYTARIASVDSDTQITIYEQVAASGSGLSYSIVRYPVIQRLMRIMWPSNLNYVLDMRYLRSYQQMVADKDTNEVMQRMPNAVISKAAAIELRSQMDPSWPMFEQKSEADIRNWKAEDDALTPRESTTGIFSYRTDRRQRYGGSYR